MKWKEVYIHFKVSSESFLFCVYDRQFNTSVLFETKKTLETFIVLLDEQERVQKKTFTKWVNIYLSLHEPPLSIKDLFEDLKDGTKLIALLEGLSGQTLVS